MNDKDNEAFEKWWMEGFKGMSDMDVIKYKDVGKQTSLNGWQAACEYMQAELAHHIFKIEAENAKLRECVEFYANKLNWYDNTAINGSEQKAIFKDSEDCLIKSIDKHIVIGGKRARQVLKELYGINRKELGEE